MATGKEKQRLYWSIFILYGIYHTLDQWTRFISPFIQGVKVPSHFVRDIVFLNAIGNFAILFGSFLIAHTIDSVGCRTSAMFVTFVTGVYQVILPSAPTYTVLIVMQLLLFANHMPMVVDALIAQIVGEDGDDKKRARLITRLAIPQSLATLAPVLAAQTLFIYTLDGSQRLCGFIHLSLLFVIPFLIKDDHSLSRFSYIPSITAYTDLLADPKMRWSLLFLTLIAAPYSAYDQTVRIQLTLQMMAHPRDLAILITAIGISGVLATLLLLPMLQARVGPQKILQTSLFLLTVSYLYLSQVQQHLYLLLGMQIQMIGVSIAFGQLSAQILGHAGRGNVGKAAAMSRATLVGAAAVAPFIIGIRETPLHQFDHTPLCYICALLSLAAIPIVQVYGTFMHAHFTFLPRAHKA